MSDVTLIAGSSVAVARRACLPGYPFALVRLLALVMALTGGASLGQPPGLPETELERLSLNPSGAGSLLLGTGELLQKGGYRLSLTGHYENDPLVLYLDGERVGSVVKHRMTGHLTAAYGLLDRLEVAVQVPVLLMQRGDDLTASGVGQPKDGIALGTPFLSLRLGLLSKQQAHPVDLSVGVHTGLPLGSAEALARGRPLHAIPSVMVGRRFGFLRAGLDVGLVMRPRTIFSEDANVRDEQGNAVRLGGVLATTGEGLRGELNLIASLPLEREGSSVEALAGARMPLSESLEAYALAGLGFGNAPGTPTFRGLLGVAFGSMPPRCVAGGKHRPEQCPELDDDNDGVKNRADACPLEGGRVDAQGCPVKDVDGDGVMDPDDQCSSVAGDPSLRGCPDTDKDGIQDTADKCSQTFGVAQFQGCPDTDKDGIQDTADACPAEPGIAELKGCPARDTDGDAMADHVDNCPSEAGPTDNQGCPAKQKQLVVIKQDRIEIKETVHFDTARATIQRRSFKLLDQVAKVLLAHPELKKVWVEGHTDNVGKPEANLKLSQRRAEAVRDHLIKKGVAPERLEARGYGQERHIASNDTSEGRAANRRVEFLTTSRESGQQ
uniref:Flagellar motor rotation protein MotB n=1 Tax=Vitiosangium cumulatum TaxID=1867796 RepID=A0A7D4XJ86_9BACT|nr:flagellar motor rotation protein MotB [Vitiosangium cumulatum]QKW93736.1 flagellar motor rotation protein MotB [Vitiosangium cumulatum]